MSISSTVGGVIKEITPSATVGGVVREFDAVHTVSGGVLKELFSKSNGLVWSLTGEDSGASIVSVSDDGCTVTFKGGNNTSTSVISDPVELAVGDTISCNFDYVYTSGGVNEYAGVRISNESGTITKEIGSSNTTKSYTITTAGKYTLGLAVFGNTGSQTGVTYYSGEATITITITRA